MNKKTYLSPALHEEQLTVENGIAVSGEKLWYEVGGQGDFDYVVTEDDQWS
ncbi:MAG: hypothetical protein J6R74_04055 [Tidjanibacter sp.]|jgi:hypothetical protein|nr:hypothetical protein [Tidjanibacter sp.]